MRFDAAQYPNSMILTVSLNSALQKVLVFDDYIEGQVLRTSEFHQCASGKGVNAARAVKNLGGEAVCCGFAGGMNGALLKTLLKQEDLKEALTETETNTRVCVTVVNKKTNLNTELIEPSGKVIAAEVKKFRSTFTKQLKKTKLVALAGTLPPGCPENIYTELTAEALKVGVPVCADICGPAILKSFKGKPKPFLVKMNNHEFKETFGERALKNVIAELLASGIGIFAVTFGKDGMVAASKEGIFLAIPPKLVPVNAIGAGDSLLGGFCRAIESGCGLEGIIRAGTGAAAASALTLLPAHFSRESASDCSDKTGIKKV